MYKEEEGRGGVNRFLLALLSWCVMIQAHLDYFAQQGLLLYTMNVGRALREEGVGERQERGRPSLYPKI